MVRGVPGQLGEGGAGQQHRPRHHVVSQPGMVSGGQPSGEDHAAADTAASIISGELDRGGEQRMTGRRLAESRRAWPPEPGGGASTARRWKA